MGDDVRYLYEYWSHFNHRVLEVLGMTVKELKEILADVKDSDVVIMSSDPEGNTYSPLYTCDPVVYAHGEVYDRGDTDGEDALLLVPLY